MTKKKADKDILSYLKESFPRPVSTRELSDKIHIAWHTADRHCLKLQLAGKVACFQVGKATAWYLKEPSPKKS